MIMIFKSSKMTKVIIFRFHYIIGAKGASMISSNYKQNMWNFLKSPKVSLFLRSLDFLLL